MKAATTSLIMAIGEDPTREGLRETPIRVAGAWHELMSGMHTDPLEVIKTTGGGLGFENPGYDEMIVLAGIEFVSVCEHHLMPFYGTAAIGYIPNDQVVGVSKLARLVEVYSRRLQIQERMTAEIAATLNEAISPKGVAVRVEGVHLCMVARGVKQKQARMITQAVHGVFREDGRARAEFTTAIGG